MRAERGKRQFALGDRVIFLRNGRGIGVKNGTLGMIRNLTTTQAAVMLDNGRSIVFDTKAYNQIDHGYAATIHKTQGVTVDRTHVLATPGLDRHAAYVALSRHRDGVEIHYGRNDFADQAGWSECYRATERRISRRIMCARSLRAAKSRSARR